MDIKKYFKQAIKEDASDLHLVGEESPILRIEGELKHIEEKPIKNSELNTAVMGIISKEQQAKFKENLELDFSYQVDNARFRVNLHLQEEKLGLSARLI